MSKFKKWKLAAKPSLGKLFTRPSGGTVIEKMALEGKYIKTGDPLYKVANLDLVWLMLELYPEDAAFIRFGQTVTARVQSLPGTDFTGRVAFVDPFVDEKTRTVAVRVEFKNPQGELRPGDYATAKIRVPLGREGEVFDAELAGKWISPMHPQIIRAEPGDCPICGMKLVPTSRYGYSTTVQPMPTVTVIPRSAVLMAGAQSVAYVETKPGVFEIRPLTLGPFAQVETADDHGKEVAVVIKGIDPQEKVAVTGNFLIDSQMQLAGKPSLIDPSKAKNRTRPLKKKDIPIKRLPGESGEQLEDLYLAYLQIQETLTKDNPVSESAAMQLTSLAESLSQSVELAVDQRKRFTEIAAASKHLHHQTLIVAREEFKAISQKIVMTAFELRGEKAATKLQHFFCPMPFEGGDWLQGEGKIANPFLGSRMLRCGDLIHELPPVGHSAEKTSSETKLKENTP